MFVVLLSIICITYNHEKYISDAIEGFVSQKTDFEYEIIIHDDASTDSTAEIIRKYAKKYPNLIKPIFQTTNQYSQGKKMIPLAAHYARGEYLALCEGDDYWIDPCKLQKQINALTQHPEYSLCFHRALVKPENNIENERIVSDYGDTVRLFKPQQVIIGDGPFIQTATIMCKKESIYKLPEIYDLSPVGDYIIQMLAAIPNGAIYLPDIMSVYRTNVPGSWCSTVKKDNKQLASFFSRMINVMNKLNDYTDGLYTVEFHNMILRYQILLEMYELRTHVEHLERMIVKQSKKIAVFGFGKSGKMSIEYIQKMGSSIDYIIDDNAVKDESVIPIITTNEFLVNHKNEVDLVVFGKCQNLNTLLTQSSDIQFLRLEFVI